MITGVEDRDLGRRLAMAGTICHIQAMVAQIRIGMDESTTDWSTLAEGERSSRENALNLQSSFKRLWASAKMCMWHGHVRPSYWHGRVSRAYLASIVWNLKRGNLILAFSRAISALAFTNVRILPIDFWHGLRQIDLFPAWHSSKSNLPVNTMIRGAQLPMTKDESK